MKSVLFPKLAVSGIIKNKKIYFPYIFSCIGSVMIYFIIHSLSTSKTVLEIKGGSNLSLILEMGKYVIAFFSLVFLLYTNSFLVRRRNTEFGLYNILGMSKKNIAHIMIWESFIVGSVSLISGLFLGFVFYKALELGLLYFIKADVDFKISFNAESVKYTVIIFIAVFIILLIKSVISLRHSDALELMKAENTGEKKPKANYVFAFSGAAILIAAYIIALKIKSPLEAITLFLVAVLMVIVATYLLFISGSVAACRLLQKNKNYYYKKNHFVSVSSMAFRMKRNGAGLASICILSTMVLVTITSTSALYFGANDSISSRFPMQNQIAVNIKSVGNNNYEKNSIIENEYEKVFEKYGVAPEKTVSYTYADITGLLENKHIDPDSSGHINDFFILGNLRYLIFIDENDYNRLMGTDIHLAEGEAKIRTLRCTYKKDSIEMNGVRLRISGTLDGYPVIPTSMVSATPSILILVKSLDVLTPIESTTDINGDKMLSIYRYFGYDADIPAQASIELHGEMIKALKSIDFLSENGKTDYIEDCYASERNDFYTTFGGLFFIGIIISAMFICALIMIIYYKQISEGFEDRAKYDIMRKVGMTDGEIKKNINSQILTVFFAPLILSGIHLAFAFPAIWKLLQLFNLRNLTPIIITALITFSAFGLIYVFIYKATAQSYFGIVTSSNKDE